MSKYYLGVDRSSQLKHWKYIKKKRGKNGKWIYYYDKEKLKDDLGFDEREARDKARFESSVAEANLIIQQQKEKEAYQRYASKGLVSKYGAKRLKEAWAAEEAASKRHIETGKKFIQAHDAYMQTPLGKLENAINKAKKTIKRLLGIQ